MLPPWFARRASLHAGGTVDPQDASQQEEKHHQQQQQQEEEQLQQQQQQQQLLLLQRQQLSANDSSASAPAQPPTVVALDRLREYEARGRTLATALLDKFASVLMQLADGYMQNVAGTPKQQQQQQHTRQQGDQPRTRPGAARLVWPADNTEPAQALDHLLVWSQRTVATALTNVLLHAGCEPALRELLGSDLSGREKVGERIAARVRSALADDTAAVERQRATAGALTDVVEQMVVLGSNALHIALQRAMRLCPEAAAALDAAYPRASRYLAGPDVPSYSPLQLQAAARLMREADLVATVRKPRSQPDDKRGLALWVLLCVLPRDVLRSVVNPLLGSDIDAPTRPGSDGSISSAACEFKYAVSRAVAASRLDPSSVPAHAVLLVAVVVFADRTSRRPKRRASDFVTLCADLLTDTQNCAAGLAHRPLSSGMRHMLPTTSARQSPRAAQ